jgi:hypothetical protein
MSEKLDHAEHDGSDKGHCEVRSHNAQSTDERHKGAPSVGASLRATKNVNSESPYEKVSLAVALPSFGSRTWLKKRKINALKSP